MKFIAQRIAIGLLATHLVLLVVSAGIQSPTFNEPAHLAAGVSNWKYDRFDLYSVNPPLVRMVASLPVVLIGAKTDWHSFQDMIGSRPEFRIGSDFVAINSERSMWLFMVARWACIPFSLLGGYVCYRWGSELYSPPAGILALTLWCFCPNILAHGPLITSDAASASLAVSATFAFWRWLKHPTWWRAIISSFALGTAELTKTSLLVFYPLWPLMWFIYRWPDWRSFGVRRWAQECMMLFMQMVISLYVINLGYGFQGTLNRLGDFRFVSQALGEVPGIGMPPSEGGNRFVGTMLADIRIPLPKHFVLGIDLQKYDFENYDRPSYLHGQFSANGWWYYYLYALMIKVPLGTLVLFGISVSMRPWSRAVVSWRDEFVLLMPPAIILGFVSSQSGFSEHMRYILPIFPFVFVWIARLVPILGKQHCTLTGVATVALAWSVVSSLWIYPHNISYFNELVGGPMYGSAHLLHSNIDWGQDLIGLKQWMLKHPDAKPLHLIYFGYFDPRNCGLEYSIPEPLCRRDPEPVSVSDIPPGWYAVSVNFIRGYPRRAYKGDGSEVVFTRDQLTVFQSLQPIAMAGYSIYIYEVRSQAKSVR